jgi:hypothetical protein
VSRFEYLRLLIESIVSKPLVLSMLCAISLGCSEPTDRVQISGTVTWEGKPLPKGDIAFYLPQQVAAGAGRIVDGKFSFPSRPGNVQVVILASRPAEKVDPVEKTPRPEQYLPARYNTNSTLTTEIMLPGPVNLQFDLTSKTD